MTYFAKRNLALLATPALLGIGCVALPKHMLIQLPIGAALLFFLPGYSLVRAIGLDYARGVERILLAVGVSIVLAIVTGLLLHSIGGLSRTGWIVSLSVLSFSFALMTVLRRPLPYFPIGAASSLSGFRMLHGVVVAASIGIFSTAIFVAVRDEARNRQFPATEFWLLPKDPRNEHLLTLGIRSQESGPIKVNIEFKVNGRLASIWQDVTVDAGQTITKEVSVPVAEQAQKVEAWMLRDEASPSIYRKASYVVKPAERR